MDGHYREYLNLSALPNFALFLYTIIYHFDYFFIVNIHPRGVVVRLTYKLPDSILQLGSGIVGKG